MTRTLALGTIFLLTFALWWIAPVHVLAQEQQKIQGNEAKDSIQRFTGTWEGKCQDGRTFVVLVLQSTGNQIGGTVSIGNMHGDDEGACMLVTAPPVPEHAQKIGDASAEQNVLSFHGSERPDGTFNRFELKSTERDKAELKLLGTPVEKHPWQLVKVQPE
jgi:hypothetical protein